MVSQSALMQGKRCLVTGATSGIGLVCARRLAQQGAAVVVVARDPIRGAAVVNELRRITGNQSVELQCADLSDQSQIHRLASDYRARDTKLDVLVNNAGAMFGRREVSADGIEMTLALNHLGYFLLTRLLLPCLQASASARIVNVASAAHRGTRIDFSDLQSERRYSGWLAYKRSKLCNLLFTYELARQLQGTSVVANALHPGFVATSIGVKHGVTSALAWRLLTLFAVSAEKGARPLIHVATAPEVAPLTGTYFVGCKPRTSSKYSYDTSTASHLWQMSEGLTASKN
jgi:NAD(P)-dependent dehydrogenase (short-subunit alcohol dehydrogenase family)